MVKVEQKWKSSTNSSYYFRQRLSISAPYIDTNELVVHGSTWILLIWGIVLSAPPIIPHQPPITRPKKCMDCTHLFQLSKTFFWNPIWPSAYPFNNPFISHLLISLNVSCSFNTDSLNNVNVFWLANTASCSYSLDSPYQFSISLSQGNSKAKRERTSLIFPSNLCNLAALLMSLSPPFNPSKRSLK